MGNNGTHGAPSKLTLSMIVKNEADRYLSRVLESAREYITDAVILDDGSTDDTVAVCHDLLRDVPHTVVQETESLFHSEWRLRQRQWQETIATDPDWILFLDADEIFEDAFQDGVRALTENRECGAYLFRLYDFWDETHYRDDALWQAHRVYRPFMLRYDKDFAYTFKQTDQHCGRMPANVFDLQYELSPYRLKHFGWAREDDRIAKYNRYMALDPGGVYGSLAQYRSILDESPVLTEWAEDAR